VLVDTSVESAVYGIFALPALWVVMFSNVSCVLVKSVGREDKL